MAEGATRDAKTDANAKAIAHKKLRHRDHQFALRLRHHKERHCPARGGRNVLRWAREKYQTGPCRPVSCREHEHRPSAAALLWWC